jgi:hypothetical protein
MNAAHCFRFEKPSVLPDVSPAKAHEPLFLRFANKDLPTKIRQHRFADNDSPTELPKDGCEHL